MDLLLVMKEHYTIIFLLSHMRAFTSLAGHILGSHPRISGYFELHISYRDTSSLDRQIEMIRESDDLKPGSHYLFDKILHNEFVFMPEQVGIENIKILVALREPEQTIKSIVHLFRKKEVEDLYASPVEATKYYIERVTNLAEFCRSTRYPYYYFDAELLQGNPGVLLPVISRWLGLDTPLTDRYQVFSQTGQAGKGDSSNTIRSGEISKAKSDYSHIDIPGEWMERAWEVYRECRQQLIDHAIDEVSC